MSRMMIIVRWSGACEKLEQTLRSCQTDNPLPDLGCELVIAADFAGAEKQAAVYERKYPYISFDRNQKILADFVTVLDAGEYYEGKTLGQLLSLLEDSNQENILLLSNVTPHTVVKRVESLTGKKRNVTKVNQILKLPASMNGSIIRTGLWKSEPDEVLDVKTLLARWDRFSLSRKIAENGSVLYVENAYFHGNRTYPDFGSLPDAWFRASWYEQQEARWKQVLAEYGENQVPLFVQAQLLVELRDCLMANKGNRNTGALCGADLERFCSVCTEVLWNISDELITPDEHVQEERRLLYLTWSALMCLKYERKSEAVKDLIPMVMLDLMEYDHGIWRVDVSVDQFLADRFELKALYNGQMFEPERTRRFSEADFFGEPLVKKATFAVKIPKQELSSDTSVSFVFTDGKNQIPLAIVSTDYEAKITTTLQHSYWCFDNYMVTLERGGIMDPCGNEQQKKLPAVSSIRIRRAGRASRMAQELRLMKEILRAPYGSKRMFAVRALYWLTYPVYGHKNIWVTFDKLYKGGDCGEYFYKYMRTRKTDGITPVYVIRKDVADYERLVREGCAPVAYQSLKQRLLYLHASMIFATHSAVHSFCGFSKWEVRFVQDRTRAVNTCIQHGLSVQDLTVDSNRIINNNKRYYCASKYEIENLSKPAYDYAPEVLRLTGLARYDGLVNRDQKQILIAPTWRAYIAMPPVMGSTRPYNPEFKQTDYFKIFQSLLENERLQKAAEEAGYRIMFLLHPVISAQKDDFQVYGNVELLSAAESNYEKLLTEASLMVTDYSGIQFDFAYMRKPVVYFHPPKLPPHYVEGGFFYDTMGFGEICTETEQLVDTLIDYLQRSCALKEFYRARQDAFFAFDDHENCRRIFEDALEYQRKR